MGHPHRFARDRKVTKRAPPMNECSGSCLLVQTRSREDEDTGKNKTVPRLCHPSFASHAAFKQSTWVRSLRSARHRNSASKEEKKRLTKRNHGSRLSLPLQAAAVYEASTPTGSRRITPNTTNQIGSPRADDARCGNSSTFLESSRTQA